MAKLQLSSDRYHFETEKGRECYVLGRQSDCDFIIADPSVSRVHAEVFWRPAGWFVRDLDSRHGVYVNGATTPMAKLRDGDELRFGDAILNVKLIRESPISSARQKAVNDETDLDAEAPPRPVIKIHGMGGATSIMRVKGGTQPPHPKA